MLPTSSLMTQASHSLSRPIIPTRKLTPQYDRVTTHITIPHWLIPMPIRTPFRRLIQNHLTRSSFSTKKRIRVPIRIQILNQKLFLILFLRDINTFTVPRLIVIRLHSRIPIVRIPTPASPNRKPSRRRTHALPKIRKIVITTPTTAATAAANIKKTKRRIPGIRQTRRRKYEFSHLEFVTGTGSGTFLSHDPGQTGRHRGTARW
nr:MAG: hypothetical protein [Cressdnaviricota sp.]